MRRIAAAGIIAALFGSCRSRPAVEQPRPNVLLVTIDTWRADRLGAGVAPALDRLADSSIRFTAARTAVPLTLPSHTTILTGLLPPAHGVRANGARLDESHPTVATLLKGAGYDTAAFVGAFVLDRRFGLARGFDVYDDQIPRDPAAVESLEAERPASAVIDRALAWLDTRSSGSDGSGRSGGSKPARSSPPGPSVPPALGEAPFFMWVHLYDPHAPYTPPPEFRARTPTPYDGEVAYADSQIARVLDRLRTRGVMDRTLVVVAGDHGEGLGYHEERTHGMLLYDSTLRVPLIVSPPHATPARRGDPVSLAQIAPTILRAVGLAPPGEMRGGDLLAAAHGVPEVYSETEYPRVAGWAALQAMTDGRWKTIRAGAMAEVYDVQDDPYERTNLASTHAAVAKTMAGRIDAIRAAGVSSEASRVSPEAERRLRSLGYVASPQAQAAARDAPNPAEKIAEWNTFEDALSALNSRAPDAVSALDGLAKRNPDAPVFQTTYARALKEAGRIDRALVAYRQAAGRWPTDPTLLHDLAVAARDAAARAHGASSAALRAEAARAEEAALALAPDSPTAHNGLGLIAVDENRPQDAVREFTRASQLDPNNASYWANLGNARRANGDGAGAEQAYRRALEIDGRAADAANGLGVLLVEAHRPAEAVPWLERAAAAPDFVEARLNLGIALQQSGQTARAADVYRSVIAAPARYAREREAAKKLLASLR